MHHSAVTGMKRTVCCPNDACHYCRGHWQLLWQLLVDVDTTLYNARPSHSIAVRHVAHKQIFAGNVVLTTHKLTEKKAGTVHRNNIVLLLGGCANCSINESEPMKSCAGKHNMSKCSLSTSPKHVLLHTPCGYSGGQPTAQHTARTLNRVTSDG